MSVVVVKENLNHCQVVGMFIDFLLGQKDLFLYSIMWDELGLDIIDHLPLKMLL